MDLSDYLHQVTFAPHEYLNRTTQYELDNLKMRFKTKRNKTVIVANQATVYVLNCLPLPAPEKETTRGRRALSTTISSGLPKFKGCEEVEQRSRKLFLVLGGKIICPFVGWQ